MARYADAEIERIKQEINLTELVQQSGVELKPHGTHDLIGHCPFHDDKTPSLVITPAKNLWHCLGACQKGGSVIDWMMQAESLPFREAVESLKQKLPDYKADDDRHQPIPVLDYNTNDQTLLNQVTAYYTTCLKNSPQALSYLKKRGLDHLHLIDHFKLGFADRSLGLTLPLKARVEGKKIRSRLEALGIMRPSGHEHLAGSLVIPVLDHNFNTLNLYGRKINDNLRAGTAYHLYLPGPHKGLFNEPCLQYTELILCESLLDALSFWAHGFHNVTTSYGVEGFTPSHYTALVSNQIQRVYIAYDNDEAGNRASLKLAAQLIPEGLECFRVVFPQGQDANEVICTSENPSSTLQDLLDNALPMSPALANQAIYQKSLYNEIHDRNIDINNKIAANLAASPLATSETIAHTLKGEDVFVELGNRHYRIRGLFKNTTCEVLKINLRLSIEEHYYIDHVDLYSTKHRESFTQRCGEELNQNPDIIKKDLGRLILKCESLLEEKLSLLSCPEKAAYQMSEAEKNEALSYLRSSDLITHLQADFDSLGLVGESTNRLVCYLACVSRKMSKPLGVLVQCASAAGKSALMDAVLDLMPPEETVKYSAMTGQSLYYMGEQELKHKILAISEEEGASKASYALKLLQSEGMLTIASTGKDPLSGRQITQEYKVEGPAMIFVTTTAITIDEELQNRCLTLTVDVSREQTKAIHARQRFAETLEGLKQRKESTLLKLLHHNVQRLLESVDVVNPYAKSLTFLDDQTRSRRDQPKYLTLIRSIALLRQYQKRHHIDNDDQKYIEVDLEDIRLANELSHEVLGRTLDELPPQTRRLLSIIYEMVKTQSEALKIDLAAFRFSQRELREYSGYGHTQLKIHLVRLAEMEYVSIHKQGSHYLYELLYQGEGHAQHKFVLGLMDVNLLEQHNHNDDGSGVKVERSVLGRGAVGPVSGSGRGGENTPEVSPIKVYEGASTPAEPLSILQLKKKSLHPSHSYHDTSLSLAATHV